MTLNAEERSKHEHIHHNVITERRAIEADLSSLNIRGNYLCRCLLIISELTSKKLVA